MNLETCPYCGRITGGYGGGGHAGRRCDTCGVAWRDDGVVRSIGSSSMHAMWDSGDVWKTVPDGTLVVREI